MNRFDLILKYKQSLRDHITNLDLIIDIVKYYDWFNERKERFTWLK